MERVILHVDMDAYFASVEQQINPFLRGKPVIVCGNPQTKTVVASASYEAKRQGVRSGMSIPQALSLCPEAVLVPGNPICYAETSRTIFSLLTSFSEEVEIYSIDEAFLDVSSTVHLFGGKESLGLQIKKTILKKTGLSCSVGIAPNKLLAKIAASLVKPDGLRIIEEKEIPELMLNLPIEEVPGIGPRLASLLSDWGITTCGQIQKLGEEFFVTRFGLRGKILYQAACGLDQSPVIKTPAQPKSIGHSYTLPFNTNDMEYIRAVIFRLSEQVASRMRQSSFYGRVVTVCVRLDDFTTFTRQKKFLPFPPDGHRIYTLAWQIFHSFSLNRKVRMLGISVSELSRDIPGPLFPEEKSRENLFQAIDRLNGRLGANTVFPATFLLEKTVQPPVPKTHSFQFWRFKPSGQTKTPTLP